MRRLLQLEAGRRLGKIEIGDFQRNGALALAHASREERVSAIDGLASDSRRMLREYLDRVAAGTEKTVVPKGGVDPDCAEEYYAGRKSELTAIYEELRADMGESTPGGTDI